MSKIEALTNEQESLMAVVRDEWIGFALTSDAPMDKVAAKQGIEWMYSLASLKKPEIAYAESPLACQIIANLYGNTNLRDNVRASVRDSVWDSVRDSVGDSVRASVRDSVRDSVWDSVWDSVRDSVGDSVWASKLEYIYPIWRDVLSDAGWVAFYDYFTRIGVINHENFNQYLKYMKSGVFYGVFLDGVAIVCGRPKHIDRDNNSRLHSENRPAVLWSDGYAQYFWHGVAVTAKIIETPEQLTKEDLIKEENAEVRRAMMEKLGTDRFFELLDVDEVNRETVGVGDYAQEYILYRTKEIDAIAEKHIQFVKVRCHSTGREFMLCVPPEIEDAGTAVAWTFGMTKAEYKPLAEA